jgi:NADH-quinone oxidoreductase subunit N
MTPGTLPSLDWAVLAPVLVVTGTGLACLLLDVAPSAGRRGLLAGVAVLGLAGAFVVSLMQLGGPPATFQQMLALDDFSLFFNLVFCAATGLVLLLSVGYLRRQGVELGEYYILVLFAALGMMLMAAAADLLVVFLGLELLSIPLYVLAGFFRARVTGNESGMKYFLLGAFASGFLLYGIALLYGATGTTNLARLGQALAGPGAARDPMILAGLALLLVGFGFKTSAVPFHQWAPDVYEGAPTAVAALIATGSKAAAFGALLRVLIAMRVLQSDWVTVLWLLAVLSMTVGNVIALVQSNLKRMLAFSSIAHVGYMLVGLTAGLHPGSAAVLFYLAVYSIASVGAFGVILLLERQPEAPRPAGRAVAAAGGRSQPDQMLEAGRVVAAAGGRSQPDQMDEAVDLDAYGGLATRHPGLALLLTLFLLALIGMPPTAGFVGKFYLFGAAMRQGFVGLAVIAVLNSVLAAYYYLRLVVYMYMREPEGPEVRAAWTPAAAVALALCAWGTLQLGLWPGPVLALAERAVAPLLP